MPVHVFTLVLDRRPDDQELDALLDAGCDDATFGVERGAPIAQFDREAPAQADAIASAVHDVESAGLRVLRVLDEDLLTLADIADRVGQSRGKHPQVCDWRARWRRLSSPGQPRPRGNGLLPLERGRTVATRSARHRRA